MHQKL